MRSQQMPQDRDFRPVRHEPHGIQRGKHLRSGLRPGTDIAWRDDMPAACFFIICFCRFLRIARPIERFVAIDYLLKRLRHCER